VSGADPDLGEPDSEVVLMHIAQPFANHNGGAVVFGPDGMLYIATGDGGSGGDPQGNGQRLDTHLGKILRVDVDVAAGATTAYQVPADNPFTTTAGAKPEIWFYGLRNPWRIRFDRQTGDLWIGDVGQNAWEEIDVARAGQKGLDYGWNIMEATHCFNPSSGCDPTGLTLPVAEYDHDLGCAVIGGVVVRDPSRAASTVATVRRRVLGQPVADGPGRRPAPRGDPGGQMGRSLSSIGEAEDGSVYATSLGSGELLRSPRVELRFDGERELRTQAIRKVTVTVTEISVVPASTGVPASAPQHPGGLRLWPGRRRARPRRCRPTPAIATPAASASTSATGTGLGDGRRYAPLVRPHADRRRGTTVHRDSSRRPTRRHR
jgi:hypothetical protein